MAKKDFLFISFVLVMLFFPIINIKADTKNICTSFDSQKDCQGITSCKWEWDQDGNSGYCTQKPLNNSICSTINSGEKGCEQYSSCEWVWNNEDNGDGYCSLKSNLPSCSELSISEREKTSYCVKTCSYEYTVGSNSINGFYTKCNFWITLGWDNNITIDWKDNYNNRFGTLNKAQPSFTCTRNFNFYNTNLGNREDAMNISSEDAYGNTIGALDFKKRWSNYYRSGGSCPELDFEFYNGSYFVYFTDKDQPIFNNGTTEDDNNNNDNNNDDNDNQGNIDDGTLVDNCNTVPEAIIEYINDALKLLRWVALALMIILGVLDFVKAAAADDQDALKKAWQRFTKRLIAVIILFLLPMLVDLILELAGLNNDCENLKIQ